VVLFALTAHPFFFLFSFLFSPSYYSARTPPPQGEDSHSYPSQVVRQEVPSHHPFLHRVTDPDHCPDPKRPSPPNPPLSPPNHGKLSVPFRLSSLLGSSVRKHYEKPWTSCARFLHFLQIQIRCSSLDVPCVAFFKRSPFVHSLLRLRKGKFFFSLRVALGDSDFSLIF